MRTHPLNAVDAAFRAEWTKLVAIVVRDVGDLGVAEEAVADAFTEATDRWHRTASPDVPVPGCSPPLGDERSTASAAIADSPTDYLRSPPSPTTTASPRRGA